MRENTEQNNSEYRHFLLSVELTDQDIGSSDSNLLKPDFKSAMFARVSAVTSSLLIFLRAASVSDMIKQHNSRFLNTNFCYSVKNTSARFGDSAK